MSQHLYLLRPDSPVETNFGPIHRMQYETSLTPGDSIALAKCIEGTKADWRNAAVGGPVRFFLGPELKHDGMLIHEVKDPAMLFYWIDTSPVPGRVVGVFDGKSVTPIESVLRESCRGLGVVARRFGMKGIDSDIMESFATEKITLDGASAKAVRHVFQEVENVLERRFRLDEDAGVTKQEQAACEQAGAIARIWLRGEMMDST